MPRRVEDFNPDSEGHVKHTWTVINASTDRDFKGVQTSKGFMKFGKKGAFKVKDKAIADEIRQTVGAKATVNRMRQPEPADRGHKYFFGQMPALPWHKYDENGKRIKEEENQNEQNIVSERKDRESAGGDPGG